MSSVEVPPITLYTSSDLLAQAREPHNSILGVLPNHTAIHTVIERGSRGKLIAGSVGSIILHNTTTVSEAVRVHRLGDFDPTSGRPQEVGSPIDAGELREQADRHRLVVPVTAFHPWTAATALQEAAGQYASALPQRAPQPGDRQPPSQGESLLDLVGGVVGLLAGSFANLLRPADKREPLAELVKEFEQQGSQELIGKAKSAIRAVQGADSEATTPAMQPLGTEEMQALVNTTPPFQFYWGNIR